MVLPAKNILIFFFICSLVTVSCSKDSKNMPLITVDLQVVPTIHSRDVYQLISDSGIVRYRLAAKIWNIYSNMEEPYWYFPENLHVERFDSIFNVDGSIAADTAYYYEKQVLWHAIGNVVAINMEGDTFETTELFWNEKVPAEETNAFYTHQVVKITKPDGTVIFGMDGFSADQSLTNTLLFSGKGELFIDESTDTLQEETIQSDNTEQP
jgi:hypothetical protein